MADKYLNYGGLSRYDTKIKEHINTETAKKGNTNISFDQEYQYLQIRDIDNKMDIGFSKETIGGVDTLRVQEYAKDDRGQTQQIINMYLTDKQYVDDEVSTKQTQILKTQSGLEADVRIAGSEDYDTVLLADETYVDNKTAQATDTTLGTIKLNAGQNIGVDANGKLTVGGRMGQFEGTTGLFAPNDREPRAVGDYSLLITDAKGMDIGNRAFAVVSGYGLSCKSAAAGSTQYRITNNYANRIIAKMCENGYISKDEATSKAQRIVPVVSVTINGSAFTPDSSANSSNDIIITTAETLNPDGAITNIRLFGKMQAYATIHTGNGIASWGGGRNLILGGAVTKAGSSNDNCLVGMNIYSSGNGNACFGRQHIATKNRGFLAGTGHDTTNAPAEGASAVGQYSYMDSNTLFAVGNGSNNTARSNAFEVRTDGIVLKSPNGTRWKIAVDNNGNLTTTAI